MPHCALCSFADNDLALKLNEFVVHYIGIMDIDSICTQVSDMLRANVQQGRANEMDADGQVETDEHDLAALGIDPESVRVHINEHLLHPRVRIAVTLRKLWDFVRFLEDNLTIRDAETGLVSVDKTNTELYLKTMQQAVVLYKTDPSSMMFNDAFSTDRAAM